MPNFRNARAGILGKVLHVVGDSRAIENAKRFGDMERDAARDSLKSLAIFQIRERPEELLHMLRKPEIEPPLHASRAPGRSSGRRRELSDASAGAHARRR